MNNSPNNLTLKEKVTEPPQPNISILNISSSLYIYYGITEENLVQNQQLFMFAIISLILMSLMFDSAPIPL